MKLRKLKKIYRKVFPVRLSGSDFFTNVLRSNIVINNFEKVNQLYALHLQNGRELFCRDHMHSDYSVFNQIFVSEEYKTVSSILKLNIELNSKESVLIDAGANVGFATVYLNEILSFDKIFCIEPSKDNFKILEKNTAFLNSDTELVLLEKALSGSENVCFSIENNFRDGRDWAITTKENTKGTISGITINEIIKEYSLNEVTLLKIDIEGAERFIFQDSIDLSFLNITKVIAIEIHDEFNIREEIYKILYEKNFLLIESGETTIGINKKYIK
ncbi:FkbM family methyltransferase [Flavobacterium panacagri]|uniref:FkbM family methyltransferase n=1 Tax=Flavobacterium panacagri TaxID=3034146 RepID=UPI0025A5806F|nr:FkbM family methyltransferase [Flavobacterium panacagri]